MVTLDDVGTKVHRAPAASKIPEFDAVLSGLRKLLVVPDP